MRPSLRAAGLPDEFRTYDFRHAHASQVIDMGASPLAVKERLGHADIAASNELRNDEIVWLEADGSRGVRVGPSEGHDPVLPPLGKARGGHDHALSAPCGQSGVASTAKHGALTWGLEGFGG